MRQVTGLILLLQESQCFNITFTSLNEFAHRLEPKYLSFASKIVPKEAVLFGTVQRYFSISVQYATWSLEVTLWPGSPASG